VKLNNQRFNQDEYRGRSDIMQIRYNPQSELACELRKIYQSSYKYISEERCKRVENGKKPVKLPKDKKEYLAIYTTPYTDTYYFECITVSETTGFRDRN
jgi:hypothetical protein